MDVGQGTKVGDKEMPFDCTPLVDGGIRRGSDVLKGLAFGTRLVGVGLGRPILMGLAAGGQQGVIDLISGITRELQRLMTIVGADHPQRATRDILIADV